MPISPEDLELIRAALKRVEEIPEARKAARILGVSPGTLEAWRRGTFRPLRTPVRDKLINNRSGANGKGGVLNIRTPGSDRMTEFERALWDHIGAIEADSALTAVLKVIKIEGLLAAQRLAVQDKEAAAAGIRARVIDKETDHASARNRLLQVASPTGVARRGEKIPREVVAAEGQLPLPAEPGRAVPEDLGRRRQGGLQSGKG